MLTDDRVMRGFEKTMELFAPVFKEKNRAMIGAAVIDGKECYVQSGDPEDIGTLLTILIKDYCDEIGLDPDKFCKSIADTIVAYESYSKDNV